MNHFRSLSTAGRLQRISLAILLVGVVTIVRVFAVEPSAGSAPLATAEEVAQEILKIQDELGGSIVADRVADDRGMSGLPGTSSVRVKALRDASWQLTSAAHRLELVDLYEEADAMRDLASELRQTARRLQREAAESE